MGISKSASLEAICSMELLPVSEEQIKQNTETSSLRIDVPDNEKLEVASATQHCFQLNSQRRHPLCVNCSSKEGNDKDLDSIETPRLLESMAKESDSTSQAVTLENQTSIDHSCTQDSKQGKCYEHSERSKEESTVCVSQEYEWMGKPILSAETQAFFDEITQNREVRFKMLKPDSYASRSMCKVDSELIKKEVDIVLRLDMYLQELGQRYGFPQSSQCLWNKSEYGETNSAALYYLSQRKRKW
eukprot:c19993_g1_i1 orf=300-1031(-)